MPDLFPADTDENASLADKEERPRPALGVWSRRLLNVPHLAAFLNASIRYRPRLPSPRHISDITALTDWGRAGASERTRRLADAHNLPYLAVEKGFLCSLRPEDESCSLVADSTGIHYDASRPSDLENLLNDTGWETPALLAEAREAMTAVLRHGLSKYNMAPDAPPFLLTTPGQRQRILIIDQPVGDHTIAPGLADGDTFIRMLEQARRDHPGAALFVKSHPDTALGRKQGHLTAAARDCRAALVPGDFSPLSLLAQADEVYAVTSHMGFEALLLGKPVHCFGLPFYAGWGLTRDAMRCPRRVRRRTVEELFAAAYLLYARYVNPVTGHPCSARDAIRLLSEQRRRNEQNGGYTACLGFDRRRRPLLRAFLASSHGETAFFRNDTEAVRRASANKGRIVVPASWPASPLEGVCRRAGVPLVRIEDGWLGREGTKAERRPASLLRDEQGTPDDASRPSTLETLLEHAPMDEALLTRSQALRAYMVKHGITLAASVAADTPSAHDAADGRPMPLDAPSALLVAGTPPAATARTPSGRDEWDDRRLLRLARDAQAGAPLYYLPPFRQPGGTPAPEGATLIRPADLPRVLPSVRKVLTVASAAGFDALLRGVPVHTYGSPFYAGWGLTGDEAVFPCRSRPLTVDMLVAGALILYPAYYDWSGRRFCGPEEICRLLAGDGAATARPTGLRRILRRLWGH